MSGSRRKPGPLGPFVDGYRARLLELGYSPLSVTRSLIVVGHLGRCGVMPLLVYLRSEGVVAPEPVLRLGPLDRLVGEYRTCLTVERELSTEAVRGTHLAHRFLAERASADDKLGVEHLTGSDVTGYLLCESARVRPGTVCTNANQLRQLLRYLAMRGFADPGLAQAVQSVGRWEAPGSLGSRRGRRPGGCLSRVIARAGLAFVTSRF